MALTLNGDDGIAGVDGSATTPAIQGTDSNTGISFGTDTVNVVTGGSTRATVDSSGRLLMGTTSNITSDAVQIKTTDGSSLAFTRDSASSTSANGLIRFRSNEGDTAFIVGRNGATQSSGNSPGQLEFFTTPSSSTSPTEQMRLTSTGDLRFNSGYGSVATAYGVRAWVNFLGTGTVTIRDSGNVSSITDNGTGDYDVNFTTAMPDDDYCVFGSCVGSTIPGYLSAIYPSGDTIGTSDFRFRVLNYGGSYYDLDMISVAVIR